MHKRRWIWEFLLWENRPHSNPLLVLTPTLRILCLGMWLLEPICWFVYLSDLVSTTSSSILQSVGFIPRWPPNTLLSTTQRTDLTFPLPSMLKTLRTSAMADSTMTATSSDLRWIHGEAYPPQLLASYFSVLRDPHPSIHEVGSMSR